MRLQDEHLKATLLKLRSRLDELHPAFLRAGAVALRAAQARIMDKNGGTWAPAKVDPKNRKGQVIGSLLFRTGHLFRSLSVGGEDSLVQDISGGIRVGTNLNNKGRPYPIYLQKGAPKINLPPRPFLFLDERTVNGIKEVFTNHVWGRHGSD